MNDRIGIIGYGAMGSRMGRRILGAGMPLTVYDIAPATLERAHNDGADPAPSIAALVNACSLVITMLPEPAHVEAVVLGDDGLLKHAKPGTLLCEMSSSYPPVTRRLHALLKAEGIEMIDAPVSGGIQGAEAGTLTVMVGGDPELMERARPALEAIGKNLVHVGGIGSGHVLKALNNLLSAVTNAAAAEVTTLAVRNGIAADTAINVFATSSGRSRVTDFVYPNFVLTRTFNANFALGLMRKDADIATRLAREVDHPMLIGNLVRDIYGMAVTEFGPSADYTRIAQLYEKWAGVEMKGEA